MNIGDSSIAESNRHFVTNLAREDFTHIIDTQISTAGYLIPAEALTKKPDRKFNNNRSVWHAILKERIRANMTITLEKFRILEWFPRSPGLYFTPEGAASREAASRLVQTIEKGRSEDRYAIGSTEDSVVVYNPYGKEAMLRGGLGAIRLKPRQINSSLHWFMSASSNGVAHEGFPLAVPEGIYNRCIDEIAEKGACVGTVIGRLQFVPEQLITLYDDYFRVPQLYLLVEEIKYAKQQITNEANELKVSVAVSFTSSYEGYPKVYASYVFFDPAREGSFDRNVDWMENTYVKGVYQGSIITDFDEHMSRFAGATFSLSKVMDYRLDQMEVEATLEQIGMFRDTHGLFSKIKAARKQFFIINRGEINMSKGEIHIGDVNMSNVSGQVFLGRFNDVIANLSSGDKNKKDLAKVLNTTKEAVIASQSLSEEQKQEQVEIINQIGEQAAKPKPNKTLLKSLGEGLMKAVKSVPDVANAALSVTELLGKFYS